MTLPASGNPHDQYFKLSFAQPELAADLVAHYLPAEVVATLDLADLVREDVSFVDDELRAQQCDLLFRAPLQAGGEGYIYLLLFEHKSYPDHFVSFQLLRYLLRIWEQDRREQAGAPLRPIVPGLLRALLQYAAQAGQRVDERVLRRAARVALPTTGGEGVATLVEQWLERGREEGIEKGLETGLHVGLRALVEFRFQADGLALMPAIEAIDDPKRVEALLRRIPQMDGLDELRQLLDDSVVGG